MSINCIHVLLADQYTLHSYNLRISKQQCVLLTLQVPVLMWSPSSAIKTHTLSFSTLRSWLYHPSHGQLPFSLRVPRRGHYSTGGVTVQETAGTVLVVNIICSSTRRIVFRNMCPKYVCIYIGTVLMCVCVRSSCNLSGKWREIFMKWFSK